MTKTGQKVEKKKTEEAACLQTAMKFSIGSLCPKFLHWNYAPVTSCDVEGSFSKFKNVQADKLTSLNEDSLEKLVVHCFRKNKNVT